MKTTVLGSIALLTALQLGAQTFDNSTLNGAYGFVHFSVDVSVGGVAEGATNTGGVITFDGAGGYTIDGRRGSGANALSPVQLTGTYLVQSNGFVSLGNPLAGGERINARLGAGASAVLGASTENPGDFRDVFIAIKSPEGSVDNGVLSGSYAGASFGLPNGSAAAARSALLLFDADGQGGFTSFVAEGHQSDRQDDPLTQNVTPATYAINADGSGTLAAGNSASLFSGTSDVFISPTGDMAVGYSTEPGSRDIFVAVRRLEGETTDATFAGDFWFVDLLYDGPVPGGDPFFTSAIGGLRSTGAGVASLAQRVFDSFRFDLSAINLYGLSNDSTGFFRALVEPGVRDFAIGAAASASLSAEPTQAASSPNAFISASVNQGLVGFNRHGVTFGVRLAQPAGDGVFIAPLGVLNAASFAPATNPVSPGELISIFGSNLAAATAGAETVPLATTLGNVSVAVNGVDAPLLVVTPNQINLQVPFGATGDEATIVVTNDGVASNTVQVPLARTSPGIFSVQQTGFGPGVITDANFQLINEQNPASAGQTVIIFLTGMGPVDPPFPDGSAGPVNPLSRTVDPATAVLFANTPGTILFSGAAPNFVGLYQLNVTLPLGLLPGPAVPIAIVTEEAFADFVDITVGF